MAAVLCGMQSAYHRQRRLLQIAILIAACVPVTAGLSGMVTGTSLFEPHADISLDSHFRYLSGLLFGLGICFWAMLPTIERQSTAVRILTFLVVVGGVTRLIATLCLATPSLPMVLAIGMELIVTPLLCLWQWHVAKQLQTP